MKGKLFEVSVTDFIIGYDKDLDIVIEDCFITASYDETNFIPAITVFCNGHKVKNVSGLMWLRDPMRHKTYVFLKKDK